MQVFSFTDPRLPAWVKRTRDDPHATSALVSATRIRDALAAGLDPRTAVWRGTVARLHVRYPRDGAGTMRVILADASDPAGRTAWYHGSASGYGYDKLAAALAGGRIGDVEIGDHCDPDGRPLWRDAADAFGGAWIGGVS